MIKNEIVRLEITDITAEGFGVGRYAGMAVFVPDTAVGDILDAKIVKVKRSYAYAIIDSIVKPSCDRVGTDCKYARKCGGCVFRHINYEAELKIKQSRVKEALKRIAGVDIPCGGIIGAKSPDGYRNKTQFPFASTYETGFFARHSHRVIPINFCKLLPYVFNKIALCVCDFCKEFGISVYDENKGIGLLRHLYIRKGEQTNEIMVVLVIADKTLPKADILANRLKQLLGESLKSFQININTNRTNVILGDKNKVIYGLPYITDILCGVKVRLSPFTFYQVNHDMAERLYQKVAEYANPKDKSVIDLYCGAGTIGLSMAKYAKSIIGVEIVPEAVEDAKINAKENGITNAEFICGDAAKAAETLKAQGKHADVIILDPPRKGCESELLHTIANDFAPERIVYVSCDPGTLARDIKILASLGFTPQEYTVFDMFPRTGHVETVVRLSQRDINY